MSVIQSLLRVMTLRDADAMVLEAGRVPSLRRRGQIEALAMDALDGAMLDAFVAPLVAGRAIGDGPASLAFRDDGGAGYAITVERLAHGLRLNVRKGAPAKASAKPAAAPAPVAAAVAVPAAAAATDADAPPDAAPVAAAVAVAAPAIDSVLARLAQLLAPAIAAGRDLGASDVIVSTGKSPSARVDGRLEPLEASIDDGELAACVRALVAARPGGADHSLEAAGVRLRINAFEHLDGAAVVARLIREHVPTFAELNLPAELAPYVELRDGLVLVCGQTGSGKSTTLASMIDAIDQRRAAHVITLEDPIEYRYPARRCLIHQREIGTHAPSFALGLRAALREAPDVILVGELRDRETIATALTAAETGHLVLATLHAPNAVGAIDRMLDAFPEASQRQARWQLASALRVVITQYLLPRRDRGRVPAVELVPVTAAVANIIRKGDLHTLPTAIQSGRELGMIPLERSLAKLLERGVVDAAAVRKIAIDQDMLAALGPKWK